MMPTSQSPETATLTSLLAAMLSRPRWPQRTPDDLEANLSITSRSPSTSSGLERKAKSSPPMHANEESPLVVAFQPLPPVLFLCPEQLYHKHRTIFSLLFRAGFLLSSLVPFSCFRNSYNYWESCCATEILSIFSLFQCHGTIN
jgi:hypothetical protein